MTMTVLVCTDGSDRAINAARSALGVLRDAERTVVVTVVAEPHLVLPYDASGMAGSAVSPLEFEQMTQSLMAEGQQQVEHTVAALALPDAQTQTQVLVGDPGRAICQLVEELDADVVVIGSRGRGGIKRALLGSVSDHVVRNASCPVIVTHGD